MLLFAGPQVALIDDLYRLLAGCEREPREAQVAQPIGRIGRKQTAAGDRLCVVDDERRIHQHRAVVAHQRRGLHHRIDRAELLEGAEDRDRAVLESEAEQAQRDRGAANEGRVEHADELHGVSWKKMTATIAPAPRAQKGNPSKIGAPYRSIIGPLFFRRTP
ncbi:hypothetical protein FQZ97_873570 [compost metagenome]